MLRPYVARVTAIVDPEDAVHVVWHDNEGIQRNVAEVLGNVVPTLAHDPSGGAQAHVPCDDLPEQLATRLQADRDEVSARRGVIEAAERNDRLLWETGRGTRSTVTTRP